MKRKAVTRIIKAEREPARGPWQDGWNLLTKAGDLCTDAWPDECPTAKALFGLVDSDTATFRVTVERIK